MSSGRWQTWTNSTLRFIMLRVKLLSLDHLRCSRDGWHTDVREPSISLDVLTDPVLCACKFIKGVDPFYLIFSVLSYWQRLSKSSFHKCFWFGLVCLLVLSLTGGRWHSCSFGKICNRLRGKMYDTDVHIKYHCVDTIYVFMQYRNLCSVLIYIMDISMLIHFVWWLRGR